MKARNNRWNAKWFKNTSRLRAFIPDVDTHTPEIALPRTAWVRLKPPPHRCRTFPLLFTQIGCDPFCGLWVWLRRTDRWPCYPPPGVHLMGTCKVTTEEKTRLQIQNSSNSLNSLLCRIPIFCVHFCSSNSSICSIHHLFLSLRSVLFG